MILKQTFNHRDRASLKTLIVVVGKDLRFLNEIITELYNIFISLLLFLQKGIDKLALFPF